MKVTRKLIEVALPLDAINKASAREKSIRHGHPSTLHLWWARRPLAAARAVIFSQMVDDPSEYTDVLLGDSETRKRAQSELKKRLAAWEALKGSGADATPRPTLEEAAADLERERLFGIITRLVQWENTTNESVLQEARDEIWQSWRRTCAANADHPRAKELFDRHKLPAFHDPFAGGGSIPLEAQRLGLEAYASDLNPVAVLINKAMIEIPPKFAGNPPVNPDTRRDSQLFKKEWKGAQGLAEDVRYYGQWMRDEAEKRIGHLYPKVEVTAAIAQERPDLKKYVGQKLTVVACLWGRTVKSPNPAFARVDVPLASTFMLSTVKGKEAYVEPMLESDGYRFVVKVGKPKDLEAANSGTKIAGANFACLMSRTPIAADYIRTESKAGRMGARLMAIVAEGERGRVYLPPTSAIENAAQKAEPSWKPDVEFFQQALGFRIGNYGMTKWSDLFTQRQLVALTTFSDLVQEAREHIERDSAAAGHAFGGQTLDMDRTFAAAYADAVETYLAFALSKALTRNCTQTVWYRDRDSTMAGFSRQAISMTWDFAEVNPLLQGTGSIAATASWVAEVLEGALATGGPLSHATQSDAARGSGVSSVVISTDPPYYDNIGYADMSDFFYVWLRPLLKCAFPAIFATVAVPKAEELVATPARHGGKQHAEAFFLAGMTEAMHRLAERAHSAFPITIYYAFKQSETETQGTVSTGWETFLDAAVQAGFIVTGTWPIRTEQGAGLRRIGRSALASSIVLVCRPRAVDAPVASRREFLDALKSELPTALTLLQRGNIAPVDLAQASIGPGMAVYTRYAMVLDAQGKPLSVREALALINQTLDESLAEQESDFDSDSRWALAWFDHAGFGEGEYGVAETLSTAKVTSVTGLVEAGIVASSRGKVRLLKPEELPADWDPTTDKRLTNWEMVHHLIRVLEVDGEGDAAALVAKLGGKAEVARELCYRLYTLCERKKRAAEALAYNGLVLSWPEITRLARGEGKPRETQTTFIGSDEE